MFSSSTTTRLWRLAGRRAGHVRLNAAAGIFSCTAPNAAAEGQSSSSSSSAAEPKIGHEDAIKDCLRKLYMLVHPDLFSDNKVIKAENERSFKLLQEYLQQARSGDDRSPAARIAYNFSFYIRRQQQQQQQQEQQQQRRDADSGTQSWPPTGPGGSDAGGGSRSEEAWHHGQPDFHNVQVLLAPPQRQGTNSQALSPTVRRALAKLFHACGLPPSSVAACAEDAGGAAGDGGAPYSLASFLPGAAEALRLHEAGNTDPAVRLANLRGAFRLGRQLLVSFSSKCDLGPKARVQLLEQLARVLDTHPELELRGCQVLVGQDPTGIDRLGQICLHQDETPADWQQLLTQADVPFVRQRYEHIQAVRRLEALVAASCGVLMVYTTPAHLPELSYRLFLERLAGHAAGAGAVLGGELGRDVPLCVLPAHARHMAASCPLGTPLGDSCKVDDTSGVIYLLDELTAAQAYDAVRRAGPKALLSARVHASKQAEERGLAERVRRALRLKRFMREPTLSVHDFRHACTRLLELAEALAPMLDGSSLRVGFVNRMAPDGSCIEIAWNFQD